MNEAWFDKIVRINEYEFVSHFIQDTQT